MKMMYERPTMDVEQFVANEFFAACGSPNVKYKFECDAGYFRGPLTGHNYPIHGKVYIDTNHNRILDREDQFYSRYHACGTTHEADTTDDFIDGIYVPDDNIVGIDTMPVVIWKGEDNNNCHCTTELDIDQWQTSRS